jgi:aldehyde dehydrogenase (NAD+)
MKIEDIFNQIKSKTCVTYCGKGLNYLTSGQEIFSSYCPTTKTKLGDFSCTSNDEYNSIIQEATQTFQKWRQIPAPRRGEIVRQIGEALRAHKDTLGTLVTMECGKIKAEGDGEIQEAIDIADFAVGLSRQLYGLTMHSERPEHRMYEQWHPLGVVGVITAFNFPAAVWAWNAMIAAVCGNVTVWKPSEKTPLTAIAMICIAEDVATKNGFPGLFPLVFDNDARIGKLMAQDKRLPLISATGSTGMGRAVGVTVAQRLGRSLLELGGNNAIIVTSDADLKLVIPAVVFGAVGTAGQRCTTTRRLIVHESIIDTVTEKLKNAYSQVRIGNPLDSKTLMGPLIDEQARNNYLAAVKAAKDEGAKIIYGGNPVNKSHDNQELQGAFVEPTIIRVNKSSKIAKHETFAPILYVIPFADLDEAIQIQNDVEHGLSSAIFTTNLISSEKFLSCSGSDCGIANVNIGTSGAEIGGAFGGEKDTGGGRESGSDSWKIYMRRQTNTINFSHQLPLAQGISFSVE